MRSTIIGLYSVAFVFAYHSTAFSQSADAQTVLPEGAKYACPMEKHPNQADPAKQGAYFSSEPGECPWCGMQLKPIGEVPWAKALMAAQGGDVAYTCPDHQSVFSRTDGKCPRCGKPLSPFKVMYTCPDQKHAAYISAKPGTCPKDGRKLVPFRGVWLAEDMADGNVPARPEVAGEAQYHCPMHPLVHSDSPGRCTICASELVAGDGQAEQTPEQEHATIPADAKYVCPMKVCDYFSAEPGQCPKCGMRLQPIGDVAWARQLMASPGRPGEGLPYVCPMHPEEGSETPGTCNICGMRLVARADLPKPETASEAMQVQMNNLMEHYLELQMRFAADNTKGAAKQALGLVAASDEIRKHLDDPKVDLPKEFGAALASLREAAVKMRGEDLAASRAAFSDLSTAMRTLVDHVRPDKQKYPKLYIYHCPMSKGDWIQDSEAKRNPYYGFDMLQCGELVGTK